MSHDPIALAAPAPPPPLPQQAPQPIAHWAHTVALFGVMLFITIAGRSRSQSVAVETVSQATRYSGSALMEWLLLGSVIAGIYHRRAFFLAAFNNRARSVALSLALGAGVYIAGFMMMAIVGAALIHTPLLHKRNDAVLLAMLPHTALEYFLWFGVSLTAGVTEELIFRGYLLQQLTAWTRKPIASIFIAALLFGCVHLYQGVGAILPLATLAVVYGLVVRYYKGDLRAVIIAHTLQDFLVPILLLAKPIAERHHS